MNTRSNISKSRAIEFLKASVDAIPELRNLSTNSQEFIKWRRDASVSISWIFGDDSRHLREFRTIVFHPYIISRKGDNSKKYHRSLNAGLDKAESTLNSMIQEIEKFWIEDEHKPNHSDPTPSVEFATMTTNSVFKENRFTVDERLVFMLSPFREPFDTIFTNHIKPTVENSHDLTCIRADDIYSNQAVIDDIWRLTNEARIVIAELTGKNPNVFYETGLAHAIGKEVILITQSMDESPFDLRHWRHIVYKNTPEGIEEFKNSLTNTITNILNRTEQTQHPDPNLADEGDSVSTNANSAKASWEAINLPPSQQAIDPDSRIAVIKLCDRITRAIDSLTRSNRDIVGAIPTKAKRLQIEKLREADIIDHQLASISLDLIGSRNAIAHGEDITIHPENLRQFIAATERIESIVLSKW